MKPEVKLFIDDDLYLSFTKVEDIDDMCETLQELRGELEHIIEMNKLKEKQKREAKARRMQSERDKANRAIEEYEKAKKEFEQLPSGIKAIFRPFFDAADNIFDAAKDELKKVGHE